MSAAKKPSARQELENIEAALVENILKSHESDLRHELSSEGRDCAQIISDVDEIILAAKSNVAKEAFERAKAELADWSKRKVSPDSNHDRGRSIDRIERLRAGDQHLSQKVLLAARKGQHQMSESDLRGLSSDLDDLERLEKETEDG